MRCWHSASRSRVPEGKKRQPRGCSGALAPHLLLPAMLRRARHENTSPVRGLQSWVHALRPAGTQWLDAVAYCQGRVVACKEEWECRSLPMSKPKTACPRCVWCRRVQVVIQIIASQSASLAHIVFRGFAQSSRHGQAQPMFCARRRGRPTSEGCGHLGVKWHGHRRHRRGSGLGNGWRRCPGHRQHGCQAGSCLGRRRRCQAVSCPGHCEPHSPDPRPAPHRCLCARVGPRGVQ